MQVSELLGRDLLVGDGLSLHGLGVIPILVENPVHLPNMDLLDEAILKGSVRITETTEAGEVPFLRLVNDGDCPVLLLEGEELVGGKQNRIINTTIVVVPGASLKIPVSCMEAGRWTSRQQEFDSGKAIFRARSRAVHKQNVSFSLHTEGSFRGEQGAVWDEVQLSLSELKAASPTSDFRAGRERVAHRIEEFVEGLRPIDGQVGAIFISQAGILGAELLATEELFGKAYEKIIRSFAFEVLSDQQLKEIPTPLVQQWWEGILRSEASLHPSPGAGDDVRCDSRDLIGSGLIWQGTCLHFSCLPLRTPGESSTKPRTRRASAGERVRRLRNR